MEAAMPSALRATLDATLRAVSCCSPAPLGEDVTHIVRCKVRRWEWSNNCQGVAQTAANYIADNLSPEWHFLHLSLRIERASVRSVRLHCTIKLRSVCVRLLVVDPLGDQI